MLQGCSIDGRVSTMFPPGRVTSKGVLGDHQLHVEKLIVQIVGLFGLIALASERYPHDLSRTRLTGLQAYTPVIVCVVGYKNCAARQPLPTHL